MDLVAADPVRHGPGDAGPFHGDLHLGPHFAPDPIGCVAHAPVPGVLTVHRHDPVAHLQALLVRRCVTEHGGDRHGLVQLGDLDSDPGIVARAFFFEGPDLVGSEHGGIGIVQLTDQSPDRLLPQDRVGLGIQGQIANGLQGSEEHLRFGAQLVRIHDLRLCTAAEWGEPAIAAALRLSRDGKEEDRQDQEKEGASHHSDASEMAEREPERGRGPIRGRVCSRVEL